ncbi:efflux RND transporter periplasmic adaptor subunit [Deminuibacter soli]|uniref:Efflux RND transporter periplasmic adaptor subunit n=1 Tax=Deminuibacter soli TaxID=2291815 RepID=A0A3E1ND65_9BACT|nr:efflux RND transporter periplasmic adaptor subunit [Deminuibacter soli]RFM25767.1 efflux RND transporter periplasmic adaptor subunit [Deminuibacter soli]
MNRLAITCISASLVTLCACRQKPPAPTPPVPVNITTVQTQPVLYYDNYPATTQALSQVDLHAQVTGYVTAILFTEGTHVHKGQRLYEIDERLYRAAYDQAAANVKVAEGNQAQAQQDADRYQYLIQHNAVARQTLDHAVIALQNAKNQSAAAQQALKTAGTNLTYSTITAPFDGTIGFSQVKLGNLVTASTTLLNTISTDNPMAADFLVNEAQLKHYQQLQNDKQHRIDSLFTLQLPDQTIYDQTGQIAVIDRAVDPQTGTIRVRLVFNNPKLTLRAGMSTVVRVHNLESAPQILIPAKAVVEQMGEYFVYLAKDTVLRNNTDSSAGKQAKEDAGKNTRSSNSADTAQHKGPRLLAIQVRIETGATIGSNILVKSGLKNGDKIVVDGIQALHDGSPITTANRQGPAAAGGRGR